MPNPTAAAAMSGRSANSNPPTHTLFSTGHEDLVHDIAYSAPVLLPEVPYLGD